MGFYRRNSGQGVIEYILLIAAVISFLILFFSKSGIFQRAYNGIIIEQADDLVNSAGVIFNEL